jgi:F0F1-type ATP synthase assembly protein I
MDKNEPNDNSDRQKETSALAKYSGLGFQMIAIIGVFAFAGYKIDQAANHQTKWVTAALSLIGVFISLYIVIRSVKS